MAQFHEEHLSEHGAHDALPVVNGMEWREWKRGRWIDRNGLRTMKEESWVVFSCNEEDWNGGRAGADVQHGQLKGSTIHPQWLQSQEQKLLRARSVAVIRMLMRIDRGHLATRGQTREFRGVARAESFLRRVCTRARVSAPRWNTHVQGVSPARRCMKRRAVQRRCKNEL